MAVSFTENGPEDDEYIDMEITSFSNFFCNSRTSREFEFQMSSLSMEREPTTSPADELFYKGKLLPLHLPPHLLEISDSVYGDKNGVFQEFYGTPLATTVTTPTSTSTPFESCNISPCDSCSVSRELNPVEYSYSYSFYEYEYSTEIDASRWIGESENPKKSWTKKLKLSSRLKASGAYLKSVFGKTRCSYESSATTKDGNRPTIPNPKRSQFGQMNQDKGNKLADIGNGNGQSNRHRRSFSMSIKRHSSNNKSSTSSSSSSSSSSSNSNSFPYLQSLKRSSSVSVKIESPIQGAIAHCKQSQMSSRKPAICEDQQRPELWRG
ncbi:MEMBRANE-ASSOCIATED KINASE REGULATOR 4 [Hibiscus trionum]|uniref:MEMBRANE-ASSOCIATED KINASE REGULATOR 4 n=1 Tax=Hibiscus trionum TaxID=183268 RepID=A0A9W7HZ07_HIBTR|nr:MEMBRANE-ASSOCIATED KINASE REGULATOR 4 [Hibiscus trionum]